MKKAPLYSRSRAPAPLAAPSSVTDADAEVDTTPSNPRPQHRPPAASSRSGRLRETLARHERRLWVAAITLLLIGAILFNNAIAPRPQPLTMQQIDAAMRHSIEDKPLSAATARAYETILPSVVRVVGLMTEGDDGKDDDSDPTTAGDPGHDGEKPAAKNSPRPGTRQAKNDATKDGLRDHRGPVERGVGTGVVIIDNGTILTNFHVVRGAKRIQVTFMDGTESEAIVMSTQPENDLAVLRAKTIPDDLEAATLRSTADLAPGDQVLAVGFPFGIGPSASSGIVSGLKREFRAPDGGHTLTNLIQFDAAANPGNSGGPLVTMDGEVVGIVTAILNPSHSRTFIGIGFAVPIENAAAAVGMPPF